ncbi:hypothetical protein PSN13_05575 [Micromonospora saelicesensis]|uniref:Uncharacterized protein n=1 Tax=Micromonospora saelicesensis TaxID=285676 RepID=A0A328NNX2_9ACTN|nr:hypothetical protein [Micromonospora saelicesensis]RAO28342.1 hypothetical protein PSN13_05575 [Micromonospora saelicesensis]
MLNVTQVDSFALPLDAYKAVGEQDLAIDRARNRLLVACLSRFGFDVEPPPLSLDPLTQNEKRYGITDASRAAQYGYREPEVDQQVRPADPELSLEAQAVISGEGQDALGGQQVPEGGCAGEAGRKLSEGSPTATDADADSDIVVKLDQDARKRTEKDSRVREVFSAWSSCMKESGYNYSGPMDANDDRTFMTPTPTEKEIAVAVADVECKRRTNLVNVWASVETAYQQRTIERNRSVLEQVKQNLELQLTRAAQVNQG